MDFDNIGDFDTVKCTFRNNFHPRTPLTFNYKPFKDVDRYNGHLIPGKKYKIPGYVYKYLLDLGYPIYEEKYVPEKDQIMSVKVGKDPRFSFVVHEIIKAEDSEPETAPSEPSPPEVKPESPKRGFTKDGKPKKKPGRKPKNKEK